MDFYEPLGLDLGKKRALAQNSFLWHMHKGTKFVLEDMIRILFFDNFKIEEWFEYGGDPYFFRLVSKDSLTSMGQYADLIRAIYELKNERSWLEGLTFEGEFRGPIYVGMAGRLTDCFEVGGTLPGTPDVKPLAINIGLAGKRTEFFHAGGKGPPETRMAGAVKMGLACKLVSRFEVGAKACPGRVPGQAS